MKAIWVFIVILIIFLSFPQKTISIAVPTLAPLNEIDIKLIIIETALCHEINPQKFLKTAKCESSLREKAIGDGGNSMGIFQIHLPSHPSVTKEEAFDPYFASEWSAKKFKKNPNIWTCYKLLYGKQII